jgi:hypothetical protein
VDKPYQTPYIKTSLKNLLLWMRRFQLFKAQKNSRSYPCIITILCEQPTPDWVQFPLYLKGDLILSTPIDLKKFKKQKIKARAKGDTLCKSGFHKWAFDGKKQFDVKQGKLVSRQICTRCGKSRSHIT